MRVPVSWLRELCDPGWDPERLAERLAMTGTEVERVTRIGPRSSEGFVVGSVLEVSPHPDADRLSVCEVATGGEQARTIVCGAPNVAAGQTVAVALPGAVLPDGTELGRAKLRGVVSDGMICSEAELELGDEHDGIMVLASGGAELAAPGAPLGELLALGDAVLELEVTPNRVDCLGVIGVGRELHAISGAPLAPPAWEQPEVEATGEGRVEEVASVRVEVPELCPRFTARAFTDVRVGPSPQWLRRRLAAAGQRPINNVVDITNYVMLLSAQPLHAFDLDRVPGGEVIVRRAAEGERMRTLDDVERELDSETVVVADRERPSGIAGIMGGQVSEVSEGTTRVLLEAATWNGVNILRSSSRLGLRSEASTRFEKQLHPELAIRAQRIAARLIVELCDARLVPGTIDVLADPVEPRRLVLRPPRTDSLLGQATPAAEQAGRLERLGFGVAEHAGELEVTVPYERHFDVTREVDLIEEVARIGGLEELPATLPRGALAGGLSREQRLRRRAEDALRGQGIDEVKTWSFARADADERLGLDSDREPGPVVISNPLSEEGRAMRTSLLGGMVDVARLNVSRRIGRIAIFESGRVYLRSGEASVPGSPSAGDFAGLDPAPALEPHRLAVLLVGQAPSDWSGAGAGGDDFYAAKGSLEALAAGLGVGLGFEPAARPFLHPGRAAAVTLAGVAVGWLGELHPRFAAANGLPGGSGFELEIAPLLTAAAAGHELYEPYAELPAVLEDLAVLVAEEVSADRILAAVREGGGELLSSVSVFDLYRGAQVGQGRKSLALRLEFRAADRTLTAEEVAERRAEIERSLAAIGGSLRG